MRASLLIIDDDEHVGAILRRVLRGYEIALATSAEEGLALVAERPFDGILCDLGLPGKSGVDFFHRVAQLRPGQELRVAFITGGATDDEAARMLARNPGAVIPKPFELEYLRRVVADLVATAPQAAAV